MALLILLKAESFLVSETMSGKRFFELHFGQHIQELTE